MHRSISLLLAVLLIIPLSCVDLDYDQPPPGGNDPNLTVNSTIAAIKAMHVLGQYEEIPDDLTFSALVISDDEEGNFFKQLVVADATGGIEMRIEMTDLHNVYPVGRKVYVKVKGLWLGDYNGLTQLGAGVGTDDSGDPELIRIPESLLDKYIITATYDNAVTPKTLTVDQLTLADVSTLIKFEDVQFVSADAGQSYADAVLQETLNREIEDCSKRRLIVRTSGFASFAGDTTPTDNGTLVGVLSIFGDDYQLTIRDLEDVVMIGERCASTVLTIGSVRQSFDQGATTISSGSISGVVISDYTSMSIHGLSMYIQDATGGIVIRFAEDHAFPLGAKLSIDVSGATMKIFHELLQIEGISLGAVALEGNPGDVIPREATVIDILNNAQSWESTLVKIKNVTLSGNTVFDQEVTVTDATGSMVLFTRTAATFSGTSIPQEAIDLTAILSEFDTPQLIMRNAADAGVQTGGLDVNEDFTGLVDNVDIGLSGWANIAVKGSRLWRSQVDGTNTYAQATAFNDASAEMESWLITPAIELDVAKKITFESAYGFFEHDGLTVWISDNFDGTNVAGANWQPVSATLAQSTDTEFAFIPSGNVDLSSFSGTVRVGFKYVGNGPGGQTTSWRIDNVKVEKL